MDIRNGLDAVNINPSSSSIADNFEKELTDSATLVAPLHYINERYTSPYIPNHFLRQRPRNALVMSGSSSEKVSQNGSKRGMVTSIPEYGVTTEREPYVPTREEQDELVNPGTARANIAPSAENPHGTTTDGYSAANQNRTVLQQHCDFWDQDRDGIIWPLNTYRGFRSLGFSIILSIIFAFLIHLVLSYPSCTGSLPDPFLRIYLDNIHKTKHGSDSGAYDNEGRFVPQKFEDFFAKFGGDKDGLSKGDIYRGIKAQRVIYDPIGWGGTSAEWFVTYLLLWPEDGIIKKDDVRRIYDGSIFYELAAKRLVKLE